MPPKTPDPECSPWVATWILASAQSTSSPFIQIFSVSVSGTALSSRKSHRIVVDSIDRLGLREALELGRREAGHVPFRAGADPDLVVGQEGALDEHTRDVPDWEGRDAPGREAGRGLDLRGGGDAGPRRSGRRGDLVAIRAPVAGGEHEHVASVAVEDERLHDLA